jgi:hypothetical protein
MTERSETPTADPRRKGSHQPRRIAEDRLARKRELDRHAQRSSRMKTKNHIAYLESRVESLTRIIKDNGNTKDLLEQIDGLRKNNEALQSTLNAITKLVGGYPVKQGQ